MSRRPSRIHALALGAALVSLLACGGGSSKPTDPGEEPLPPPGGGRPASIAPQGWQGGQTAPTGSLLSPAVVVKDGDGRPVEGVDVDFTVAGGGGRVSRASVETNAAGVASVDWTLGGEVGENRLTATVDGVGEGATFVAATRRPRWTYMVYLAADNNLAADGVGDLDEMEAAGVIPDVRVVVQAEFSKEWLAKAGCDPNDPQACINRPNWNTFRYAVDGQGAAAQGPNGQTQDLGDVDMTKASSLRAFVAWAKGAYPADRYALVLWNHGGGFTGLIEDATTAGSELMKVTDLQEALGGDTRVDIVDFDMCLMGGYETLAVLKGVADYVAFSEEVVPSRGNPYTKILNAWKANPDMPTRAVAEMFVDEFAKDYQGDRASTTRSAYDMAGFASFESSLDQLATTLRDNVGTLRPAIQDAAARAQSYQYPQLKDLVNLLDGLGERTTDPALRSQIDAVKAQATSSFRVAAAAHNGTSGDANRVDRSSGLHIVLPSGVVEEGFNDNFQADGPASLASYSALYPTAAWTQFLTAYTSGGDGTPGGTPVATVDQQDDRLEVYVAWNEEGAAQGVDVDMVVLEPNGNLFVPALGVVTPNGHLTNDSADDETYYEGYLTNRFVEPGQYIFFASLYADPQSYDPQVGLFYRSGQGAAFNDYWQEDGNDYPRLSKASPLISEDASPTFEEVFDGAYNDFKFVGGFNVGTADLAGRNARPSAAPRVQLARMNASRQATARRPTAAQLRTVREALAARRAAGAKASFQRRSAGAALGAGPARGAFTGPGR